MPECQPRHLFTQEIPTELTGDVDIVHPNAESLEYAMRHLERSRATLDAIRNDSGKPAEAVADFVREANDSDNVTPKK